ncbi:hypothetical protein EW093_14935 [Thiospirochaeta perfilievii]|uniref:Uncharacterized protein n=1 Tax=Thiospirochaeta perfilievii TaxID=252967 RepID=A0A5C1QHA7_9SPIO|nr:hypothetical protein [Thiospirochaeta perfilievii]QEN05934.1 hypothetical protein EW093_14935 [Thiospirochaeta perfilievii]
MKVIKISIITVIILLSLCCVTTSNKLPSWVEIKPENSKNDIFFSFGPASSRELAKKGLYKEISEYFGVNVSSVDKFVKSVEYNNGESSVNQTKESSVEVTSREKGLDSIQIREIWSDSRGITGVY